jgi:sporulation protein YunB
LDVVETAIKEEFGDTVLYDDVVLVARDSTKRIASIQTNATRLGILTSKITAGIQDKMLSDREERVGIPLGAFIGSTLFSAEGPDIYVKYIPAGKVDINYKSEFSQLGVNQLKHIVDLQVRILMGISLPFAGNEREIVIYVPLVENIIVGNMPTIIDK